MLELRKADEIHREQGGWFDARWHFSFDRYRDPEQMGIGPLRVFNDDRLVPGAVWPMHPHADVEGITYVVEGEFRHQDSVGGDGVLLPGAVQRMTLGSGARHSEQNGSPDRPMRFLQFWLLPDTPSLEPGVEQRQFDPKDFRGALRKVLAQDGGDAVYVHQDASAYVGIFDDGQTATFTVNPGRGAYAYVMDGVGRLDEEEVRSGDAAKIHGPHELRIEGDAELHVIVIEVPIEFEKVGVWARS